MTATPLVSVVLPTYNRRAYLEQAVASVLAQRYGHIELLVIDDGSTDATRAWLERITDARVRPVFRERMANAAALRNLGVRESRGSLIAFLDSDDRWRPGKLAAQVEAQLARPECGWGYVGRVCVDERGSELHGSGIRPFVPYSGWILEDVLELRALIATSAVMVERPLFDRIGGFNESLLRCQDSDLWLRLAEASQAAVVPALLVEKRIHAEDRHTNHLDVMGYMNRIYADLLARTRSPRIRRLCRRRRTRVNLDIVDRVGSAGRPADTRRALASAFRHAGWHPRWWATWIRTLLQ